mgnify:FL=1
MFTITLPSPLGPLTLASDGAAITGLWLAGQKYFASTLDIHASPAPDLPVFDQTAAWLDAYFSKAPLPAMPPLAPSGSPFRQAVWALLREIPYGATTTYGALAQALRARGIAAAPQAVGGAVGHNPISILIPCHRVVGADGSLTGYAGGVEKKHFLLALEGVDLTGLYIPQTGTAL